MKYLLDIAVILIFLSCVTIGMKRGFIKTVAGVVALVVALAVSALFSTPAAQFLYDETVEPVVTATVVEQYEQAQGTALEKLDNAYTALPSFVKSILAQTGVEDANDLANTIPMGTSTPMAESVNTVVRPVVLPILKAVCSLALFILVYILASLLMRVLNLVTKLPMLKQLNKTLGLVGGVVSGVLWSMVAATAVQLVAATGILGDALTLQTVEQTALVNWLIGVNPLTTMVQDVLVTQ